MGEEEQEEVDIINILDAEEGWPILEQVLGCDVRAGATTSGPESDCENPESDKEEDN